MTVNVNAHRQHFRGPAVDVTASNNHHRKYAKTTEEGSIVLVKLLQSCLSTELTRLYRDYFEDDDFNESGNNKQGCSLSFYET